MDDVYFGDLESCFPCTIDDFQLGLEDPFFNPDCEVVEQNQTENSVKYDYSPSHESDSGFSSALSDLGSPQSHVGTNSDSLFHNIEDKDLFEADSDLFSFLMESDDGCNSKINKDGSAVNLTSDGVLMDVNMNVQSSESGVKTNMVREVAREPLSPPVAVHQSGNCKDRSNCVVQPPLITKTASVRLVRLTTPSTAEKALKADLVEDKSKKNAIQAKLNREKKKKYVKGLENDVNELRTENKSLKIEGKTLRRQKACLEEEVAYLKAVLANESSLSNLLQNIPFVGNVKLSSSFVSEKRSADRDHDYGSPVKKCKTVSGGVCLHVNKDNVSLEFCSHCAKLASAEEGGD